MLDSAAGAAALAAGAAGAEAGACAKAGIAIAVAKRAAERTERVRFILLDLLGSGRPLMGRNLTIRGIAIPVPSGSGKIYTDNWPFSERRAAGHDAIGLCSNRFAYDRLIPAAR